MYKQTYQLQLLGPIIVLKVSLNPITVFIIRLTSADNKVLELLSILTPLEPLKRHKDVRQPRAKNTGTWLLKLEPFYKWQYSNTLEENGYVFCCYGIPGAGKTVIWYEA